VNTSIPSGNPLAATFRFKEKPYSVVCVGKNEGDKEAAATAGQELEAAEAELEKTFQSMENLYGVTYKGSPSALDTSTWLLMGALNLAHRVVRLEREAATQTRDLEERLSKLLEDVPDDAAPTDQDAML